MALYLSLQPMTKGEFDALLKAADWRREGGTAHNVYDNRTIGDIDKVPTADGKWHILFEAKRCDVSDIAPEASFVHDDDLRFYDMLGMAVDEAA